MADIISRGEKGLEGTMPIESSQSVTEPKAWECKWDLAFSASIIGTAG